MESLIQYLEMLKKALQNEISSFLVLTDFQVKSEGHTQVVGKPSC